MAELDVCVESSGNVLCSRFKERARAVGVSERHDPTELVPGRTMGARGRRRGGRLGRGRNREGGGDGGGGEEDGRRSHEARNSSSFLGLDVVFVAGTAPAETRAAAPVGDVETDNDDDQEDNENSHNEGVAERLVVRPAGRVVNVVQV